MNEMSTRPRVFYVRYMDDMVLCGRHKADVCDSSNWIKNFVNDHLLLEIPFHKTMPLGQHPIPFLPYILDHQNGESEQVSVDHEHPLPLRLLSFEMCTRPNQQPSAACNGR